MPLPYDEPSYRSYQSLARMPSTADGLALLRPTVLALSPPRTSVRFVFYRGPLLR
jgi:hypothetical protein